MQVIKSMNCIQMKSLCLYSINVYCEILYIYIIQRETHPVLPSGIYSASLDCGKDLGHPTPAETLRRGQGRKYLFSLSASHF